MKQQFIFLGLMYLSSTVFALYPAANYDSIVKSSVLFHSPVNHHQQKHVINRNGAFLIDNFKKTEEPHRALVIHKPVLITSLSNKPATIVETHKNRDKIIVTQKQSVITYKKPEKPVTTTEAPVVHEEKHVDEPVKFTINIEQPKVTVPVVTKKVYAVHRPNVHSNQAHSQLFVSKVHQPNIYYGYAPQVQSVIPQQFNFGYPVYEYPLISRVIHKPNFAYVSKPTYEYGVPKENAYVSKPTYEYGVPKENATVSFVQNAVAHYTQQQNILPLSTRQFGYSFTAPILPGPSKSLSAPNNVNSAPKPHSEYQQNLISTRPLPVQQFGYSYIAPEKPVASRPINTVNVPKPSYEYGVPKEHIIEDITPQKFGYSYTIYNQPATRLIEPISKPSTEYGVPKLIQPVPKPSTEYGVPKVSSFGPIVVAPFNDVISTPVAVNQHLPIVGKYAPFVSN